MFLGHNELQKQAAHYFAIVLKAGNRILFRAVDKANGFQRNGLVAAPIFLSAPRHTGRKETTGAQGEERLVAVDYLNAVAVEALPKLNVRRLARAARRSEGHTLPVESDERGVKDGGVIVEHGGADFLLHGDALQKGRRKTLEKSPEKIF